MYLDRVHADVELLRNLLVARPSGDQLEDLALSLTDGAFVAHAGCISSPAPQPDHNMALGHEQAEKICQKIAVARLLHPNYRIGSSWNPSFAPWEHSSLSLVLLGRCCIMTSPTLKTRPTYEIVAMKQCSHPCPVVAQNHASIEKLRAHIIEGHQCLDAWLALSELVKEPRQRRDCLERAAVLAPENEQIQVAYLEAQLRVEPNDLAAQRRMAEIRTMQLIADVKTLHFHERPKARLIGDILVEIGAISDQELQEALRHQKSGSVITADRRVGTVLLQRGLITPSKLAKALITQQQERSQLRIAPQVLGEYLVEQRYILPEQLELALAEQLRLDQRGQRFSLGQILVRLNMVTPKQIDEALEEQERSFWSKFGY